MWLPSFNPSLMTSAIFCSPLLLLPALLVDYGGLPRLPLSGALGVEICTKEYKRTMSPLCKESNRNQISCHLPPCSTAASIHIRIWVKNSSLSRLSSCCAWISLTSDCYALCLQADLNCNCQLKWQLRTCHAMKCHTGHSLLPSLFRGCALCSKLPLGLLQVSASFDN